MTAKDLTIYIGWDSKEPAAAAVLAHSILTRASKPVYFMPLTKRAVERVYTRPRGPTEATEFSMTRFLVPYLSGYEGWSLFIDCDFICQADIWELMRYPEQEPGAAVYVCQHDYVPKDQTKFLGQKQTAYPRKNWSSLMLFDNAKCSILTPEVVNKLSPMWLHRFAWLDEHAYMTKEFFPDFDLRACDCDSHRRIGSLPLEWNWLSGEYDQNPDANMIHYTNGGPWFPETANCDHADLWFAERDHMLGVPVAEAVA
jgi:lipopolysaccharide biosynthesis glycosyltransferase